MSVQTVVNEWRHSVRQKWDVLGDVYRYLGGLRAMFWKTVALMGLQAVVTGSIIGSMAIFLQTALAGIGGAGAPAVAHAGRLARLSGGFASLPVERRIYASFALMAATLLLSNAVKVGVMAYSSLLSARAFLQLRREVFVALARQTISFFDLNKKGDLIQLTIFETRAHFMIIQRLISAITNLFNALVTLAAAVVLSWRLTLLVSAFWLLVVLLAQTASRVIHRMSKELTEQGRRQMVIVEEVLGGMKHVKLLNFFPWTLERFDRVSEALDMGDRKANLLVALQETGSLILGLMSVLLIVWLSFRYHLLSVPSLVLFIYVLYRLVPLLAMVNQDIGFVTVSMPPAQNVIRFLDGAAATQERSGPVKPERFFEREIRFQDVSLDYRTRPGVLRQVSFSIQKGQTVALVGPSGAGKSSLANLLVRLYDPTGGRLLCDGVPLQSFDLGYLRDHIGMVSQEATIFNMTVLENILMARPNAALEEVHSAARRAYAHDFISALPAGYDTLLGDRGVQLSGGQRQRIQIGQLFLKNPEILVLDEATSALDSESEHIVHSALKGLSRDRTTLVIAHRLSTVRHANQIIVLESGRLVEQGTWNELMGSKSRFYAMVQRQTLALVDDSEESVERPAENR